MTNTQSKTQTATTSSRGTSCRSYDVRLSTYRDQHFIDTCRRLLSDPRYSFTSVGELTAKAITMPAPAFYVSYDYALRRLRKYLATGRIDRRNEAISDKWVEIIDRTQAIMRRHGLKDSEALIRVLEGTAPRFYISELTGKRLYHRIRHNRKLSHKTTPDTNDKPIV